MDARPALRPSGRRVGSGGEGGEDAGGTFPGHASSGAQSGSKDTSSCHLQGSVCSRQARDPLLRVSPPSLGRRDVAARARHRQGWASAQPPGSHAGVLGAADPGASRTRPGHLRAGSGGQAGPGARHFPSPEPGWGAPAWGRPPGSEDQRLQPQGAAPARTRARRCSRTPASCSPGRPARPPGGGERASRPQACPLQLVSAAPSELAPRAHPAPRAAPLLPPAPRRPPAAAAPHL